jgi:hypothetical protein
MKEDEGGILTFIFMNNPSSCASAVCPRCKNTNSDQFIQSLIPGCPT